MSHALHPAHIAVLNSQPSLPLVARWSVAFAVLVTKWDTRLRTRRQLKDMPPHLLKDVGMDQHTARSEASKHFWEV